MVPGGCRLSRDTLVYVPVPVSNPTSDGRGTGTGTVRAVENEWRRKSPNV